MTDQIVSLFHPRRDHWDDHFQVQQNGKIALLTAAVRVTAQILNFKDSEFAAERARLLAIEIY